MKLYLIDGRIYFSFCEKTERGFFDFMSFRLVRLYFYINIQLVIQIVGFPRT